MFLANTANAANAVINESNKAVEEIAIDFLSEVGVPIVIGLAIAGVIYAGVLYITSGGDPEKVTKAHTALKWAVAGAILVAFSVMIVITLENIINTKILTP